jgi:processive 1,2-diacylglycerol beta-glucosyltransferase
MLLQSSKRKYYDIDLRTLSFHVSPKIEDRKSDDRRLKVEGRCYATRIGGAPLVAPRILVMSAAVGAGHLRAAEAVELALAETIPSATVKNLDILTQTNAAFRRVYGKAYLELVNKAPHVLGYFYDLMDQPSHFGRRHSDRLRLLVEKLNLRPFIRFLKDQPWDLIINTHFLPAEIIASLRARGSINTPQVTVTTDFETHRLWVNQPCDHYFTATDEGALYLQSWGVPASQTTVAGIPIHPVFSHRKERAGCLARQGVKGEHTVVLQLAGGFGVGPIDKIYRSLLQVGEPLEVLVGTGRNLEAREILQDVPVPSRHKTQLLGYTDQIDELLTVADLVVSKPGGLTTSETLARGAAMVIVNPIPGQESRNSDYLLENGAAIKVNNLATLAHKVTALIRDPRRLAQMKHNARKLGRPRAAFDVVDRALMLVSARKSGLEDEGLKEG